MLKKSEMMNIPSPPPPYARTDSAASCLAWYSGTHDVKSDILNGEHGSIEEHTNHDEHSPGHPYVYLCLNPSTFHKSALPPCTRADSAASCLVLYSGTHDVLLDILKRGARVM